MVFFEHPKFFDRYASALASYHSLGGDVLGRLRLGQDGPLSVSYAPFDHTPREARLVIVGITPGRTQAVNAIAAASAALRAGKDHEEASRLAKLTGSFSGAMRSNLVSLLDCIGLSVALKVETCAALFDPAREQVHFTSALRYPVFIAEENYNGSPDMLKTRLLKGMIDCCLADEAQRLPNAVWLPLGNQPARALQYLCSRGILDRKQVLDGLPHPSGANAERIAYFTGRKARELLSPKTNPDTLDAARERLKLQVASIRHRAEPVA
jgi:hypothetical protein